MSYFPVADKNQRLQVFAVVWANWATAREYLWSSHRDAISIVPAALGDLSQAIGAALSALYKGR